MKKISIIVACYNEFLSIEPMHARVQGTFQHLDYQYELIFVDNASTDDSIDLYKTLVSIDKNVKAIIMSKNYGSPQSSLFTGVKHASGDAVVITRGNLQDPPEAIPDLVQKWEQGFDVVYAKPRNCRWGSDGFYIMDRKVADTIKKLEDKVFYNSGFNSLHSFKKAHVEYIGQEPKSMWSIIRKCLGDFFKKRTGKPPYTISEILESKL
jgi:glycosyltransferase involved in cell wall biosynthesis